MNLNIKRVLPLTVLVTSLIFSHCAGGSQNNNLNSSTATGERISLDVNNWGEGTEITRSGLQLIDHPFGILELKDGDASNDSILIIAVHGYRSQGYEWVTGVKNLAEKYGSMFFYRYDWELCPDQSALKLSGEIKNLAAQGKYEKIVIFAHSYGGVVLTYAASQLGKLEAELHIIAAPLTGFPQLLDNCSSLKYDQGDKLVYPKWQSNVRVIQHRTVHAQDGAFRDLASDPQDIDLPFFQIQELPPTMDGHRLGHNWSVTWVLDQYIGKPHRY